MNRRSFLAASIAGSTLALTRGAVAETPVAKAREFYQIRRYSLTSGPQSALTEHYLADALIPALMRRQMGPIGAFKLEFGEETPVLYAVIPGASVEALATLDLDLAEDQDFLKAGEPFWSAPASAPAFQRVEYTLLAAFSGWPRLRVPAATATKAKRMFQLRTYESPSHRDHVRKVEMFNAGEFNIFEAAGFSPVFFGDTLIGPRLPSLTYMLSMADSAAMDAHWESFRNNADWKKLSSDAKYSYEPIVSNITNLTLSPLTCSQI